MASVHVDGALVRDLQPVVLAGYAALLRHCAQMLAAARADDWARLLAYESAYVDTVERLGHIEAGLNLDAAGQQSKAELLERILEHDFEIRERLLARREELGRLISAAERGHVAGRAYRSQQPLALPEEYAEPLPGMP